MITFAALLFPLFGLVALAVSAFTLGSEWKRAVALSRRMTGNARPQGLRVRIAAPRSPDLVAVR
ncbi:hypothetical protein B2G71_20510 [Novosphingobium sp. PC22D]|uniref:hypothetical protein n=1 Tax=Novosphingobium sp. PC22D TaxID=1962403 RepID=UPI000BF00D27|nr:hypothetical protein [Novosphingobium sp. PC22D]PEQ10843.1 hypothetical protein B2G71_20510 [Novosphingobium sp. PC22D]